MSIQKLQDIQYFVEKILIKIFLIYAHSTQCYTSNAFIVIKNLTNKDI